MAVCVFKRWRSEAVPFAATIDDAEERLGRAVPRELRELVDSPDQHRGQPTKDLFVDGQDGDALSGRLALRESARSELVAAVGEHARPALLVGLDLHVDGGVNGRAAPWAGRKLIRSAASCLVPGVPV